MSSTDLKISTLKQTFPEIKDETVLLEILASCNGSAKEAESILLEQFDDDAIQRKRKINSMSSAKYQSSIRTLFNGSKKQKDAGSSIRAINKSNTKTITLYNKEDVETALPYITYHKNFLPQEVANNILRMLISDKEKLISHEFYIHSKLCHANHKSGSYIGNDSLNEPDVLTYNGKSVKPTGQYNDDMRILQMLAEDKVESLIRERPSVGSFQPKKWEGEYAICNLFESKNHNLDWHSDRMSDIGPLPVIASMSLGATREFKVRKNHPVKLNPNPIYSIPLPHNTLIIMHSGSQEEYKHCVTLSVSPLENHIISNQMRFNLTLRYYMPKFYRDGPRCKCQLQMLLRRSYKDVASRGKYFWLCSSVYQNKGCGMFHWANFDSETMITDDEKLCSVWIADDDGEKADYLKANGLKYDREQGVLRKEDI